nr:acyl-CoA dehydrogenase family protein [Nocardia bovistercoris]
MPVDRTSVASVTAAWERHARAARRFSAPLDAAVGGGFGADRLGYAFLSGYQEALRALLPSTGDGELLALSATEAEGGHPAAIRTRLVDTADGWRVTGTKTFTTLAAVADRMVVIASTGTDASGRNALRAVLVPAAQPGVTVTPHEPTSFAPEIPHATVEFADAWAEPLSGDGYTCYLKPFRTLEDGHVLAATLGLLIRQARKSGWSLGIRQSLLAAVAALRGLDWTRPSDAGTHIALGGIFEQVERLIAELDPQWAQADSRDRERWLRDRRLLGTAGRVRALRLASAWRAMGEEPAE